MLTPSDLTWRRKGIGGSDARIIAKGDAGEWAALRHEKLTGEAKPIDKQTQLLFDLGHAIEAVCLDHFSSRVEAVTARGIKAESLLDPYFRCMLDGLTADKKVIEAKAHFMDRNIEDLLETYWPQLQHQMFVTATKEMYFAVIFGHYARFENETVKRDENFLEGYQIKAYQFKAYVETGVLPDGMAIPLPVNIERKRDHVWPVGDNVVAPLAAAWLDNMAAQAIAVQAEKDLKAVVPDDCRTASWTGDDGRGLTIKIDKSNRKSLRQHMVPASKVAQVA